MNLKQKPKKLWTTAETADFLHCNTDFVRNLKKMGLLTAIEIHSRCWRFDPEAVKEMALRVGLRMPVPADDGTTTTKETTTNP